jgi:glycosyltransferase involved in cell wall biosynthesis
MRKTIANQQVKKYKPRLCVVGNLLGRISGNVTTQGQIIADLFSTDGYLVTSVSSKKNPILRLIDIVLNLLLYLPKTDILIVEVYSGQAFIIADIAGMLAKLFGVPAILVLHGGNLPDLAAKHPVWVRRVLKRAAILVAPSAYLAKEMSMFDLDIRVIPNVINVESYSFRGRRKLSPKIIWMRSFHEIYNPQMAIDVLAIIKRKVPDATLVMAGVDKGLEADIKRSAINAGLFDSVRFPGFLDESAKRNEFSNADIYINTNRIDNMPISVVEAFAMGVPVVATDVGGISYLISHGENGLLVKDDDPSEMASALLSLLKDPQLANYISVNGRRLAERSDWRSVRKSWEGLFAEILKRKTRRSTKQNPIPFVEPQA